MSPRLKTEIWIKAHIRRCRVAGIDAYLRHRGHAEAGGILLKIDHFAAGCELLEPTTGLDGERVWMRISGHAAVTSARAEEVIARRRAHDPDLWVVEIEDPNDAHSLDEPII